MSDQEPSESAKRALGTQLKELRRDTNLSGVELARRCGWHKTKVSKIEHGAQIPTEDDIRAWATACGVEGQIPELIAVSREIEQMWTDYKRWHRPGIKRLQFQAMDLYAKTKLLRAYESLFIPGFLQTVEYAKAQFTIHAKLHGLPLDDVEEAAQNRMVRKRFLGTGAPIFSFLLEASALTNNTGGVEVMSGQLDHLLEVMKLQYVSIGIIPQGRVRSLYPGEGFYLFDESLLKQEFWSGAFQTSRPENISHFVRVFAALRDQAVFGTAARSEIEAARSRLQGT
ncbi:helix-turn-helix domain-containing protein [Kitasatospora kifunensis]|uniref:Transcriptional regulator with XRE-family HTH domain n=1 Tax=Kitasatospora kifunensis TaxID=58351 RepID=A0A7W7R0M8_KITKI|nr:helix-turn-helix transcriptional regulator [Kitasatospora kifunensis]MBB4922616.1 transcriptional regulator with XRE-family HTH domain [Kitasatospora kifunensis]